MQKRSMWMVQEFQKWIFERWRSAERWPDVGMEDKTYCRNRGAFIQKQSSESKACVGQNWYFTYNVLHDFNSNAGI